MRPKLITNPFIVYALGFLSVTILYSLHWSYLYPTLSIWLLIFIIVSSVISILIGLILHSTKYFSYTPVIYSSKKLWLVAIIIFISYLGECVYMRTIPLLAILNSLNYDYRAFGIPTFHVLLVTFNSFWAVFVFHNYVSSRKKHLLLCYILCLFPAILIFNRGMFLLNLSSSIFVLLMSAKNLKKILLWVFGGLVVILFIFGIAGNIRTTGGKTTVNDVFLKIGGATNKFKKSAIPKEFFWTYIYVTSPLANVQQTINVHQQYNFSLQRVAAFINTQFLPDFISKRNVLFSKPRENINLITNSLTVGSVYSAPFAYLGWWGLIAMFIFILLYNFLIILLLRKKAIYFISGLAILDCIMLFNIFDNMFAFSGLSMQLFYPIVIGLISKIKFKSRTSSEELSTQLN